jgi:tripartite-type tricarboxylate transporter receptor subunit TctC
MKRWVVLALSALCVSGAHAFPTQRVTIIVPYSPGGPTDLLPRLFAPELSKRWQQPVVVENRVGAAGQIGTEVAARAKPDGYTLLTQGPILSTWKLFVKDLPFDPVADFRPIALFGSTSYVMVTNPATGAKTLKDFIALARSKPKAINYGTIANSGFHLDYLRFQKIIGAEMNPVPFPGAAPAVLSVLRNDTQLYMGTAITMVPPVGEGRLIALAITGDSRLEVMPNVPTTRELGVDFTTDSWTGLLAPAKTPDDVVAQIDTDFQAVLKMPTIATRVREFGLSAPAATTPQQFGELLQANAKMYADVAHANGIQPQ